MKKYYYSLFAAATMLLATTSCSQDEELVQQSVGDMTTFKVELQGAAGSRTAGDGLSVNKLYYAVYNAEGTKVIYPNGKNFETASIEAGQATVNLPLMKTEKYDIVFWAQNDDADAYSFTELTDITVNYDSEKLFSNKENRDAFFNALDNYEADGNEETIQLRRPFAQLNVATHIDDWNEGTRLYEANGGTGAPVKFSAVTVSNLANKFNAKTGEATKADAPASVTFNKAELIDESIKIKGTEEDIEYKLLAMNYVLMEGQKAPQDVNEHVAAGEDEVKATVEVAFTLWKDENSEIVTTTVSAVPVQRNYRTNILGNFLTGDNTQFNIQIAPIFDNDDHNKEFDLVYEGTDKVRIYNHTGLMEFVELVNKGTTFKGYTVYLENDIDLNNETWTPINNFQGTFDGMNKTIKNLYIGTNPALEAVGFFGELNGTAKNFIIEGANIEHVTTTKHGIAVVASRISTGNTVENVTVKDAVVKGNRQMGGIAGSIYGHVKNCTVENIKLIATPDKIDGTYDNGDKVGGVVGYAQSDGSSIISGNIAKNVTIEGYRDLGGITGMAKGNLVTNNTVSGLWITLRPDYTPYNEDTKSGNAGAIVGRLTSGKVDESNVATGVLVPSIDEEGNTEVEITEDVKVSKNLMIQARAETGKVTIKGNGNTVISTAESAADFNWNGNTPVMSTIFAPADGSKVTVSDLNFGGTMSALMLGEYVDANSNWFETELNNVNIIDAKVVSFSSNIAPAVCIYGKAELNNCSIEGTTLSELDTDPMWPVYDLAAVNYTDVTLNDCEIGSLYMWNQAKVTIAEKTTVETIVVRGNMNKTKYGLMVKSGATVETIDLSAITDRTKVNITIEDGATVNKIVANNTKYSSIDEYKSVQ